MSDKYAIDRLIVPKFYVPKRGYRGAHKGTIGRVLAPSSEHFKPDWITVGDVSKQTPFGQGIFMGFARNELREATKEEVLKALTLNHPYGKKFRPHCREALDAQYYLVMSQAIGNWTNDEPRSEPPVNNISRREIVDYAEEAIKKYEKIMKRWKQICNMQIEATKRSFNQKRNAGLLAS